MAAAAIFENQKNGHISDAVQAISTKFWTATQFGDIEPSER